MFANISSEASKKHDPPTYLYEKCVEVSVYKQHFENETES